MHVLIIAQYFPPDVGGASTRAYNAARGLVLQGYRVTVLTAFPHYPHGNIPQKYRGRFSVKEEKDGIELIRTWIPSLPHSSVSSRIRLHLAFIISSGLALARVRKCDIVFAMNPNLFSFLPALAYKLLFRKEIIRNIDDLWPEVFYELGIVKSRYARKLLDFFARKSYEIPAVLIPISNGYVSTLVTKYKIPREKIVVIEHGVDIKRFHGQDTTPARRTNNDTQLESRHKVVMYSGALNRGYDFEVVFEAAKLLQSEPIQFVIRGTGELQDEVEAMVKSYNLKNLQFETRLLTNEELVARLHSADIFLLPLGLTGVIDQGLPTKVLEYQALEKPIICVSSGEPARYIQATKSGLVTKPRQPEELAAAIKKLVQDNDLAQKLAANGSNYIRNNLTLEMVGARLKALIDKVTNS